MPIIKIRKNRNATGEHDKWRVISGEDEYLVAGASIKGCTVFTQAEVVPSGDIKYNICIDAHSLKISKGVAYIK